MNTRTIAAIAGSALALTPLALAQYQWATAASGSWSNSGNWTPAGIPNAPTDTATIGLAGPFAVSLTGNIELASLSINNPAATLAVDPGNGQSLRIGAGGLNVASILTLNTDASQYDTLAFSTSSTITGSGRITLNASPGDVNSATIAANSGTVTINSPITIDGLGVLTGTFINRATLAGSPGLGLLAQNATITQQNAGRVFLDTATHRFTLGQGSTLSGGIIRAINGAAVQTLNTSTIAGVSNQGLLTIDCGNGSSTNIGTGGITGPGTITINSDASQYDTLLFTANASLSNNTITLNANAGDFNSAAIATATGVTGTLNATISGQGVLTGTLINQGTIGGGTGPGIILTNGSITQTASGKYLVNATNQLATIGNNATLAAGSIQTASGGAVQTVGNNTLTASPTDALTIATASDLWIQSGNGGITTLGGPAPTGTPFSPAIVNNGTITINPDQAQYDTISLAPGTTITGSGTIALNANLGDLNSATLNSPTAATLGSGLNIRGVGVMSGTYTSQATIRGGTPPGLNLADGSMTQFAGQFNIPAGNLATVNNNFTLTGGTLQTSGTGAVQTVGNSTLNGVNNTGTLWIQSGNGGVTSLGTAGLLNGGTITINPDQAQYDTLAIPQSTTINSTNQGQIVLNANTGDLNTASIIVAEGATLSLINQTISGLGIMRGSYNNTGTIAGGGNGIGVLILASIAQQMNGTLAPWGLNQFTSIGEGGSVSGGTFAATNGGIVQTIGPSTLSGILNTGTLNIESGNGGPTTIRNLNTLAAITNTATITINSDQSQYDLIRVDQPNTRIAGSGSLVLNANTGDFNTATIFTETPPAAPIATLTLSGNNIRGSGVISGLVTIDGSINPGFDAVAGGEIGLIISNTTSSGGQITLTSANTTTIQLASNASFDRLQGNAAYQLDGTLNVSTLSFTPDSTDFFDIIRSFGSTVTGRFTTLNLPTGTPRGPMHVAYLQDRVRIVACYANCDGSDTPPVLGPSDFACFLTRYRNGEPYANCDGSTTLPVLGPSDFACFLNKYRAGC